MSAQGKVTASRYNSLDEAGYMCQGWKRLRSGRVRSVGFRRWPSTCGLLPWSPGPDICMVYGAGLTGFETHVFLKVTGSKPEVTGSKPSGVSGSKPSGVTGSKPSGVTGLKPSGTTGLKPPEITGSKPSGATGSNTSGATVSKPCRWQYLG